MTENNDKNQKHSIAEIWQCTPPALQRLVLSRIGTALVIALLTILAVSLTKDWTYSIAFLLAVASAYLGLDIIWKVADGKIYTARMVVCKTPRTVIGKLMRSGQACVTLRDASIKDITTQEFETHKFSIVIQRRDQGAITAGTVMDIYVSEATPDNILAYTVLGEISQK